MSSFAISMYTNSVMKSIDSLSQSYKTTIADTFTATPERTILEAERDVGREGQTYAVDSKDDTLRNSGGVNH